MARSETHPGYIAYSQYPSELALFDGLATFRKGYCALVVLASILQLVFFHEPDNWLCVLVAALSSIAGLVYSLQSTRFQRNPVSCLMLMFYTTTSTSGALLVKTMEWSALVDRLQVASTTFGVLFATQLVLIGTHAVYLRLPRAQAVGGFISRRVYAPLGLFTWPTNTELWLLGALGCIAVMASGTDYESGASFGMASAGQKLMRAFQFLKFSPFLIPFRNALSGTPSQMPRSYISLVMYFGVLVVLSFATNSRSTFADAVPTVGICALIASSYGAFSLRNIPIWKIVFVGIAAALAAVFLTRIALAMVVVRDFRSTVDVIDLVKLTFEAMGNSEWLAAANAKMNATIYQGNYSEEYVNSRFLARFLLTKFHDNILYYFSLFGPDSFTSYQDFVKDRLWAMLPEPLLKPMGITLNKEDLVISNGDYIVYMIDGWGLGGFKTGSMIAEVYSMFGVLFPVVMFLAGMMLFVVYDAFVVDTPSRRKVIAPLIILIMWNLCGTTAAFGLGAESIASIPGGIIRGLPQNIIFYAIAMVFVRTAAKIF